MPLLSFSEPSHIPRLLSGEKKQTTRQPRKRALKVGDVLRCYYKPRIKTSCRNCITSLDKCRKNFDYERRAHFGYSCLPSSMNPCNIWANFFGEAVVSVIKPLDIMSMTDEEVYDWAIADGFESFQKADEWFSQKYSRHGIDGSDWVNWKWECIRFEPRWII